MNDWSHRHSIDMWARDSTIVNFVSSVAHVWLPRAKTTVPIVKILVFS
jgi:hypothetical protein